MTLPSQRTLVELLRERAQHQPDRIIYTFLDARGQVTDVTYAELDRRARAIAVELRRDAAQGERVLQLFPSGLDFIYTFFGSLYAGLVGVPLPRPSKPNEVRRIVTTAHSARATCVATTRETLEEAATLWDDRIGEHVRWLVPAEVDLSLASEFQMPELSADSLAYLQFTSGSTGTPKGVMISHRNILANEEMIRCAFEHDDSSTFVGWLPHSHDMGLIGNILQPLYINARCVLMSPSYFIRDPLRWLRAISDFGARTSGGPNFAYDLCVRRLERQRPEFELDLSHWEIAFVGSEPIRAQTLDDFARAYAPYGFRRRSFFPCYGLAEATLLVSAEQRGAGPQLCELQTDGVVARRSAAVVSCGAAAPHQSVCIVDPETHQLCADGTEGEIWVAGPHVAAGYWDLPSETERTFGAKIAGCDERYLRTGDLATRRSGAIYVTGRLRDLIIVRGQNYYPQDIEAGAEAAGKGIRPSASAAFAFEYAGQEHIALTIESDGRNKQESVESLCSRVRAAVIDRCDVRLDVIVLIAKGSLLKTTSGKVERRAMRAAFFAGKLNAVGYSSVIGRCEESWDCAYRPATAEPASVDRLADAAL